MWLKDYLYAPLISALPRREYSIYLSLFIVCFAAGLWHGGTWSYIFVGLMIGAGVVGSVIASQQLGRRGIVVPYPLALPLTFLWYLACAALLRNVGLDRAREIFGTALGLIPAGAGEVSAQVFWVFPGLAWLHYLSYREKISGWITSLPAPAAAALFGALYALVLSFLPENFHKFIYFGF
jgi:hypothetical protein